ncbi:hypothetical protein BU16DRAFT_210338 [Lophium mytilinum]|uniref:Uncharacterized protein n=1 Tax=Lophium mytilinum TaxID=390894 RepID=A0A6A6RDM2_9PEZI|nr:hypothetical protein BU16DRAFT_210338 [Lophium mytilinum]
MNRRVICWEGGPSSSIIISAMAWRDATGRVVKSLTRGFRHCEKMDDGPCLRWSRLLDAGYFRCKFCSYMVDTSEGTSFLFLIPFSCFLWLHCGISNERPRQSCG